MPSLAASRPGDRGGGLRRRRRRRRRYSEWERVFVMRTFGPGVSGLDYLSSPGWPINQVWTSGFRLRTPGLASLKKRKKSRTGGPPSGRERPLVDDDGAAVELG